MFAINRALAKDWTLKMTHRHRLEEEEVIERVWGNLNLLTLHSYQELMRHDHIKSDELETS